MRLTVLTLNNFGPFKSYSIDTSGSEVSCLLLTGKNNEGKSNLILALKLLSFACKVIGKKKQEIYINKQLVYRFLRQDIEELNIKRLIYNYSSEVAEITGEFENNFTIYIYIDPGEDIIYANFDGAIPSDVDIIFGFIPPLGQLADREEVISNVYYLNASLNSTLAPRHFRNHLYKLNVEQYLLVKEIVSASWDDISLEEIRTDYLDKLRIDCFYKEKNYDREVGWAGQGLQVWFQIITHLVRLLDVSILVLDEPEINLHPEKQNDLIRILREYFSGDIIIATHSIELMNDVNVNHIINVKKGERRPKIKATSDKINLEIIRSQIGSSFNFISSQFEDVDIVLFTEDVDDYKIISSISSEMGINKKVFNIPIHGFSEYKKAKYYKDAYKLLIGKEVNYSLLLDKDYYPDSYLDKIKTDLGNSGISVLFTPGKEIENIFIESSLILDIIPRANKSDFLLFYEELYDSEVKLEAMGSFIKLHQEFATPKLDLKTITIKFWGALEKRWMNTNSRPKVVPGKLTLGKIRTFVKTKYNLNIPDNMLIEKLLKQKDPEILKLINNIFHIK